MLDYLEGATSYVDTRRTVALLNDTLLATIRATAEYRRDAALPIRYLTEGIDPEELEHDVRHAQIEAHEALQLQAADIEEEGTL
jgi:hypothetical protein